MAGLKIHHLNCGSFCPLTVPIINPHPVEASCHCLLVETDNGLVLIDSGYGTLDVLHPTERLGLSSLILGVKMKLEDTALEQVKKLGFSPQDVQHIVLTHLDPDHLGGVHDFPWAQVHLFEDEFHTVRQLSQKSKKYRQRFRPQNWPNTDKWNFYPAKGESWYGFESVRDLSNLPSEILMIPLTGHSPGHCGIAIQQKDKWLVHGGDSYFQRAEITSDYLSLPASFQIYQSLIATNNRDRLDNQKRLRELLNKQKNIEIFCSHDMTETKGYIAY